MSTNYMTVLESEIFDLEPRLWRLKQAVEVPDPKMALTEIEKELMKLRFETTLKLYRILIAQHELFEMDKGECEKLMKEYSSAESFVEVVNNEPDYSSMKNEYMDVMRELDTTNRFVDSKWMSITRPEDSIYKDYPDELKKALKEEARAMLKETMSRKEFKKMVEESKEEENLDYFQRYEKRMLNAFPKKDVVKMVAEEKKYYKALERWNKNLKKGVK